MNIYDVLAPIYERLHNRRKTARQIDGILDVTTPSGQDVVLDLGGGTGRIAVGFVGQVHRVVVVDPSEGMLAQAGSKLGLAVVRGSSENLPASDNNYDLVICVDAFHHFEDQEKSLDEVTRVLAPGGRVFLQDFDADRLSTRVMIFIERLLGSRSACYRTRDLRSAFKRRGLTVARETRSGSSYSFLFQAST